MTEQTSAADPFQAFDDRLLATLDRLAQATTSADLEGLRGALGDLETVAADLAGFGAPAESPLGESVPRARLRSQRDLLERYRQLLTEYLAVLMRSRQPAMVYAPARLVSQAALRSATTGGAAPNSF